MQAKAAWIFIAGTTCYAECNLEPSGRNRDCLDRWEASQMVGKSLTRWQPLKFEKSNIPYGICVYSRAPQAEILIVMHCWDASLFIML